MVRREMPRAVPWRVMFGTKVYFVWECELLAVWIASKSLALCDKGGLAGKGVFRRITNIINPKGLTPIRVRRPEGWQCVEGGAERSAGRRMARNEATRNTLPDWRPPGKDLTAGKLTELLTVLLF